MLARVEYRLYKFYCISTRRYLGRGLNYQLDFCVLESNRVSCSSAFLVVKHRLSQSIMKVG